MKRLHLKLAATAFLLAGTAFSVSAQTADRINIVTTAVPFLRISPDARAGAMGETGIATLPDANAPFWNLAKTPFNSSNTGIALTYTPWLKDLGLNDVYLASLAGYLKPSEEEAISMSVRYFSLGTIQFTDGSGNLMSNGRPREFSLDLGYSRKLSEQMGVGLALRYIRSNLVTGNASSGTAFKPGSTVAADLSWYYNGADENGEGFSAGAVLSNLGGKIGYTNNAEERDYIPANLGLGGAYTKVFDEANKVTFALDINKLMVPTPPSYEEVPDMSDPTYDEVVERNDAKTRDYRSKGIVGSWFSSFGDAPGGFGEELKEFTFSAGAEYWYNNQFALRAGYFYENKDKGNRKYFTVGAGIKYNAIGINFSYLAPSGQGITRNPLSNTLRFGLVFDLDAVE
ncbi:type IX secretion system outer membrane channel protein PorV [Parasegetibacter sp. NRK P23]|uniref:type IX secretion system outer membrane channel protein PorV n=1 Tax=Parasegetibacter sp. NRK P23 TaxID=2942999 RepID=UPI0020443EBE|nr:type IX secretion system outer membrane channel protein PorV [Parasegetibacter sp. NRK P23]MCM5527693.1 type IX secretion system outer membrane channel protein PorV [Parasegetibacter sp. NRK P23]